MGSGWKLVLLVLLMVSVGKLSAQPEEIQWYNYSKNYKTYIPVKEAGKKVSFFIDLNQKETSLVIEAPQGSALFFENRLLARLHSNKVFEARIDSLKGIYQLDSAFVTIYNSRSLQGLKTTLRLSDGSEETERIRRREASADQDFFVFGFVLVLMIAAVVRLNASPQVIYLLSFRQIFLSQVVDNPFYSSDFFSMESVRIYSMLALGLSLTGLYFAESMEYNFPLPDGNSFISHLIYWFIYAVVIYVLFYLKLLLYKFISGIYNFRRYTMIQNYDFMRISMIVSGVYFLILFADLFLLNINLILLILVPLIALIIYLFVTFKKLNKTYSHTKLHLFSYLCVSEMVPCIFLTGILGN
ncbi:MAG: DUF4271 domain-containing protein [Bacteroidota bacterium]